MTLQLEDVSNDLAINLKICQSLLEADAEMHMTNKDGKSPLMIAREKGLIELVSLLEQHLLQKFKAINDSTLYDAKCGTVFKGKFGGHFCAFIFYIDLIVQGDINKTLSLKHVTPEEQEKAIKELHLTKELSHSCLVTVYDVLFEPLFENVVLLTEMSFNSLFYVIHYGYPIPGYQEVTSALKLEFIKDIVSAVEYLHNKDIFHNYINISNVLLFQTATGNIIAKLGGFGVTRYLDNLSINKLGGVSSSNRYVDLSMEYLAPELLQLDGNDNLSFSKESDIYALGITINEIMTERPPYPQADTYDYFFKNVKGTEQKEGKRPNIFISNGSKLENSLRDKISNCLANDILERPNVQTISDIFVANDQNVLRSFTEVKNQEINQYMNSEASLTSYIIQNIFKVMRYVNDKNEVTLFVDNEQNHFKGNELFLLVKSLRSKDEDPATEASYQFISSTILIESFSPRKYDLINERYQVIEDSLGYYAYDINKYSTEDDVVPEDDRIRGVELFFIATIFRDYDSKSEVAYQFIKRELEEIVKKINRCRQKIKKVFNISSILEVIITDINAKNEKESPRQFLFQENGLIEKGDNSNRSGYIKWQINAESLNAENEILN